MKKIVQKAIRKVHIRFFSKALPERVALYFHSLEPKDYSAFRAMWNWFSGQGYRCVGPDEFAVTGSGRRLFLSFDDNYSAWFKALGLFDELKVQATFYVNTFPLRDRSHSQDIQSYFDRICHTGERVTLSSDELKQIAAAGHTIGNHTYSHHQLTSLPFSEAREEIKKGKEDLENIIGTKIEHFSYPFGMRRHFSEELRAYCKELGFRTIANAIPALQYQEVSPFEINRSIWNLEKDLDYNLKNIQIDGRLFERLTGRSAVA